MKRLTKVQLNQRAKLVAELTRTTGLLRGAFAEFNEALSEAQAFTEEVAQTISEAFEGRSERWRESPRGEAVAEWQEAWEEFSSEFGEAEIDIPKAAEALEQLPDEPEEDQ